MRFGSICSGIEAASVAWDRLGWEAAWLAEVDVSASRVLAHRLGATAPVHPLPKTGKTIARLEWGDRITNWGDMTRLPDLVRSGVAEAPDILCGGTPCQAFSVAGRREGLADARGQLTLAFVDLADAIDLKRAERGESPCVVFWENVPGVLSSKDNAFGCLLAALAGEDDPLVPAGKRWSDAGLVLGPERTVAWRVFDAQYFGLAQRRRRVFVIASSRAGFDPGEVQFEFDGLRRDSAPSRETGEGPADPAGAGASEPRGAGRSDDPDGAGPRTGRHHRLTPQGYRLVAFGEYADDDTASTMQARDCKDVTDLIVAPPAARAVALRGREGGGSIEMGGDVANALRASGGGSDKEHVLAPIPLVELGCRTGRAGHEAKDGLGVGEADQALPVLTDIAPTMIVRRLMPVECERLQGFPTVVELDIAEMTRDEVILAALINGDITVDLEKGKVFGHRGPGGIALRSPRELGCLCPNGYRVINLTADGVKKHVRVNRVIWTAANGPIPEGLVIDHKNNRKNDNRISNLQAITRPENSTKAAADGCYDFDDAPGTKLTAEMRRVVFFDYMSGGESYRDLALRYGVCKSRIGQIVTETEWTKVPVGGKMAADGARYKQLGNSWAVSCVRWYGARIAAHLADIERPVIEARPMNDGGMNVWVTAP